MSDNYADTYRMMDELGRQVDELRAVGLLPRRRYDFSTFADGLRQMKEAMDEASVTAAQAVLAFHRATKAAFENIPEDFFAYALYHRWIARVPDGLYVFLPDWALDTLWRAAKWRAGVRRQ